MISSRFVLMMSIGCLHALAGAVRSQETGTPVPGSVLLASADGVSVFDRAGAMSFGRFTPLIQDGKPGPLEWSDMIYDGCRLPSGNYLCSSHHFVRELAPDGGTVWEFRVQAPVELKTCAPLPNGDVMTVDAQQMELVQLTDHGKRIAKRIPVPTDKKAGPHNRYNLLRRTEAGTFLLALRAEKAFIEVDDSGKVLWRHPVPDLPVVAERLADGNTLMSWRGGLIEATPDHKVVWELKTAEITEFPVIIFGGFHRFATATPSLRIRTGITRRQETTGCRCLRSQRTSALSGSSASTPSQAKSPAPWSQRPAMWSSGSSACNGSVQGTNEACPHSSDSHDVIRSRG